MSVNMIYTCPTQLLHTEKGVCLASYRPGLSRLTQEATTPVQTTRQNLFLFKEKLQDI